MKIVTEVNDEAVQFSLIVHSVLLVYIICAGVAGCGYRAVEKLNVVSAGEYAGLQTDRSGRRGAPTLVTVDGESLGRNTDIVDWLDRHFPRRNAAAADERRRAARRWKFITHISRYTPNRK